MNKFDKKKLRILHIVIDEKFTDIIIDEFKYFEKYIENHFVICKGEDITNFKYLKQKESVVHIPKGMLNIYIQENKINVCILHSLRCASIITLLRIPSHIKLIWFAWGFDLYKTPTRDPFIKLDCYKPLTKKYLKGLNNNNLKKILKNYIEDFLLRILVRRIDFFSGCLPVEYELMKKCACFKAKPLDFSYSKISSNPHSVIPCSRVSGENILVGNSGDESNNHLDIFECLKKLDIKEKKIYVPLSYAGSKDYIERVKYIGHKYFGDNFIALETFLPVDAYKTIISSCGFLIYGHERQQALGNIDLGLRSGCKIFLSKTSVNYDYFTSIGCVVFSIQDGLTTESISNGLDEASYIRNINVMQSERSPYVCYNKLKKIIETLYNVID